MAYRRAGILPTQAGSLHYKWYVNFCPGLLAPRSERDELEERVNDRRSSDITTLQFGHLPGTAQEAEAIAPLLPDATLLTGDNATENALKQLDAPNILHLATHGFFLDNVQSVPPPDTRGELRAVNIEYCDNPNDSRNTRPINNENPLLRSGLALGGFNPRESG